MSGASSPPLPAPLRQRRQVGVATADFSLFADVVAALKRARITFLSFDPHAKVPGSVGVVVTSAGEARAEWTPHGGVDGRPVNLQTGADGLALKPRWRGRRVLALDWEGLSRAERELQMVLLPFRCLWALAGYPLLRVGVDPGPRPGVALLTPEGLLADYQAADEEQALAYLLGVLKIVGPGQMVVRVGHGAPLSRNRLANGLLAAAEAYWGDVGPEAEDPEEARAPPLVVEIVDETGSSSGTRAGSNLAAAARIAATPGYRLRKPLRSHIKPSDIARVQERSRRLTKGRRTLSAVLAEQVAGGQLTFKEALARSDEARAAGD